VNFFVNYGIKYPNLWLGLLYVSSLKTKPGVTRLLFLLRKAEGVPRLHALLF
jgi:hypothetical protein